MRSSQASNRDMGKSTLIPLYTAQEARQDLIEEVQDQIEEEMLTARVDLELIETFVRSNDPDHCTRLNEPGPHWNPDNQWTFLTLEKDLHHYHEADAIAKDRAKEALRLEQQIRAIWDDVAFQRTRQGRFIQWFYDNNLHDLIRKVDSHYGIHHPLPVPPPIPERPNSPVGADPDDDAEGSTDEDHL
jgi:hypothetical protein